MAKNAGKERSVGVILGIGILIFPLFFSWLTLRKGYTNKSKIISFSWLVLLLLLIGAQSGKSSITEAELKDQPIQDSFCDIISTYRESYLEELDKEFYIDQGAKLNMIFDERTEKLKSLLKNGEVKAWEGVIDSITVSKGKGAYLNVEMPCNSSLNPQDNLIIKLDSPLYEKLRGYSEGSKIVFSGNFMTPPEASEEGKYPYEVYYGEKSFTKRGSMEEPEFIFKFTDFL